LVDGAVDVARSGFAVAVLHVHLLDVHVNLLLWSLCAGALLLLRVFGFQWWRRLAGSVGRGGVGAGEAATRPIADLDGSPSGLSFKPKVSNSPSTPMPVRRPVRWRLGRVSQ